MKTKAYLYIITAAICWGLIGLFVRTLAAQGFSSMQIGCPAFAGSGNLRHTAATAVR